MSTGSMEKALRKAREQERKERVHVHEVAHAMATIILGMDEQLECAAETLRGMLESVGDLAPDSAPEWARCISLARNAAEEAVLWLRRANETKENKDSAGSRKERNT